MRGSEKNDSYSEGVLREVVKDFHVAIGKSEMYGKGHPAAKETMVKAYTTIRKTLKFRSSLCLSVADDGNLIANGASLKGDNFSRMLAGVLNRKNVSSIVFGKALKQADFDYLLGYFLRSETQGEIGLSEYLMSGGIETIAANSVEYRRVSSEKDNREVDNREPDEPKRFVIDELKPLAASRILQDISGLSQETIYYLGEQGILRRVEDVLRRQPSSIDPAEVKELDALIERHRAILGPERGAELESWYRKIRKRSVFERPASTSEVAMEFRKGLVDGLEDFILLLKRGVDLKEAKKRLLSLFELNLDSLDLEGVEIVYHYLKSLFAKNPIPGFLIIPEVFVASIFARSDQGLINNFSKKRISEKVREVNSGLETEFLTTTMVWLVTNYLARGKTLQALNIARIYDLRRKDSRLSDGLVADAQSFFASMSVGAPLESLILAINEDFFSVPMEVEELIRMIDSKEVYQRLLDAMSRESQEYTVKISKALKRNPEKPAWVFVSELSRIGSMPRDMSGKLLAEESRRRLSSAMTALAIVAGDKALPMLVRMADDRDQDIKHSALDAIAQVASEEAIKVLVKWLYSSDKKWHSQILLLLQRLDSQISVPILVRFFHTRRDQWIDIIRVVGQLRGDQARAFLIDTLYLWNSYTSAMNSYEKEEFILTLLDSIAKCEPNEDIKNALKSFISEWQDFDLLRGIKSILGVRKDLITDKARRILSEFR